MRFDHRVSIDLMLEDSALYSLHQLKNKISKMRYTGGATVTQLALKEVKEKIFNGPPRHGVPRTCILLTDGKTYRGRNQVIQPANELRVFVKISSLSIIISYVSGFSQLFLIS